MAGPEESRGSPSKTLHLDARKVSADRQLQIQHRSSAGEPEGDLERVSPVRRCDAPPVVATQRLRELPELLAPRPGGGDRHPVAGARSSTGSGSSPESAQRAPGGGSVASRSGR